MSSDWGSVSLCESDPDLYKLIREEKERQRSSLELIASENFCSKAVQEAVRYIIF